MELEPSKNTAWRTGCGGCLTLAGFPLFVFPLLLILMREPLPPNLLLAFIAGAFLLWKRLSFDWQHLRFEEPQAFLEKTRSTASEADFYFRLKFRKRTQVRSIFLFVCRKESAQFELEKSGARYGETGPISLIASERGAAGLYRPGQEIILTPHWSAPLNAFNVRVGRNVKPSEAWVETYMCVRVRIVYNSDLEFWREYRLPERIPVSKDSEPAIGSLRYDLYVKKVQTGRGRLRKLLRSLLPFLKSNEVEYLGGTAYPVLESLTPENAERAKEMFEAVGAEVELHSTPPEFVRDVPYEF